jgi:hypothetical protein
MIPYYETERFKYATDAKRVTGCMEQVNESVNMEERAKHEQSLKSDRKRAARVKGKRKTKAGRKTVSRVPPSYGDDGKRSSRTESQPLALSPSTTGTPAVTPGGPSTVPSSCAPTTTPHLPEVGITATTGTASTIPVTGASTTYPSLPDTPTKANPTVTPGSSTTVPVTCALTTSPSPPDPTTKSHPAQLEQPHGKIPVRRMRDEALQRYQDFQEDGRIEVQTIDTFQGRKDGANGNSATGCVVISTMMVMHHLAHPDLLNENIKTVIDDRCVEHIGALHALEGSTAGAFLDPFNVHAYFDDQEMLQQVDDPIQGNALNEGDMGRFLQMLCEKRKAGGTFFSRSFHKHFENKFRRRHYVL